MDGATYLLKHIGLCSVRGSDTIPLSLFCSLIRTIYRFFSASFLHFSTSLISSDIDDYLDLTNWSFMGLIRSLFLYIFSSFTHLTSIISPILLTLCCSLKLGGGGVARHRHGTDNSEIGAHVQSISVFFHL